VFTALASFAGALCTFSNEMKAQEIPVYNHTDLTACFGDLENQLRVLLDMVVAANYVKIPLEQKQQTLFAGAIPEPDLTTAGQFYLGVSADVEETKLINEFPIHGKIISPDKIDLLIQKNLPGVGMTYLAHPPAALPVKAGLAYFRLDTSGDRWDFVKQSNEIAIYGPPQLFPGLTLELMAIKG
jgi:type VI secretion system protein ImpJ